VQRDELNSGLAQVVVCMVTSKTFRSNHPSRVAITLSSPEGANSGLLADSVVMTDNLATIATSEVDRVIGTFPMPAVDAALRHTLSL
jgi:mRNA interferase MazF